MRALIKSPTAPSSKELDLVERFLDEGGSVAKSFVESMEAGGVMREDILRVSASIVGLLQSGLTEEALICLIQLKAPKQRNGRPIQDYVVKNVLDALAKLHEYVQPNDAVKKAVVQRGLQKRVPRTLPDKV